MRKLFTLLSLLVLTSMILAACGGAPPATQAQPPAATEPEATEPPATTEEPAATEAPAGEFASSDPTTYFVATFGEPETLDPAIDYESAGLTIIQNVYDSLVFYDHENPTAYIPQLATEWTVSDDGLTYTFNIREGVTFHEGGELTPSDVAYTFQRGVLVGGQGGATPQWLMSEPLFGIGIEDVTMLVDDTGTLMGDAEALAGADSAALVEACERVKSAIVADDAAGTVTITLAQSWGPFIASIAPGWGSIMDKEWTIENGGWDDSCDTWQNFYGLNAETSPFTTIANGTGPFKLDHWTQGEELVLVRNDEYWRTEPMWEGGPSGPAALERVVIQSVDEFGTRFAMFQAGDTDTLVLGSLADQTQVEPLVGEECVYNTEAQAFDPCVPVGDGTGPARVYRNMPQVTHTDAFFNFNIAGEQYIGSGQLDGNGIPPDFFADVHIRKAFNYCFDWETYINDALAGEAVQTLVLPVAGMPGFDSAAPHYTHDPAQCEAEFKLADVDKDGVPAGEDPEGDIWTTGFRFAATYNQGNTARQTAAEILASNVGSVNELFLVELLGLPWPAFLQSQREQTLPLFFVGWIEDIHDPHNWYQPYLVGTYASRQSLPEELSAQYKELLNQGVAETDPEARHAIYQQVNQLQYDNPSGVMLATSLARRYEQRWVQGWYNNPILPGTYYYSLSKQ
jgi:peptide/nickel transport system substrate-binding protein